MKNSLARGSRFVARHWADVSRHSACWPVLLLLGYALLAYYRFIMTTGAFRNSDDTGNLLAGVELAEGNWNLAGWIMATDNYYPTDVLGQAVLRVLFGFHPIFMQLWEGLVWGGVAWAGTWLACADRPTRQRPGIVLIALAMLAFNIFDHRFADNFMSCVASHGCTILLTLAAFALIGTGSRHRLARLALFGAVITIGCFSDPVFNVIACLPVLAVGVLSSGRRGHAAILVVTAGAMVLARLLVAGLEDMGGFRSVHLAVGLARFPEFTDHLWFLAESIPRLLGANFFARPLDQSLAAGPTIQLLRAPMVLLFIAALCGTGLGVMRRVRTWPKTASEDRISDLDHLLWFSVLLCMASACATTVIYEQSGARFFLPAAVAGSVLAARRFGRLPLVALYAGLALPASAAMSLATLPPGQTPRSTMVLPQFRQIATVLRENHLSHGYGGYWEGTMLTVSTHRDIVSLPLTIMGDGRLHPFRTLTNLRWYSDAARQWRGPIFFISASRPGGAELPEMAGRQQFGSPRKRFDLGQFVIEVFDTSDPAYHAPTD